MKVLYITFINEDLRPGYKTKIHSQCKAFHKLGVESYLYIVKKYGMALYHIGDDETIINEYRSNHKRKSEEKNIYDELNLIQFWASQLKIIVKNIQPDMVYVRRIVPLNPWLMRVLSWIKKRGIKIIYEYPSHPWKNEMIKSGRKVFYLLDCFYYKRLIRLVDIITYMGVYLGDDSKFLKLSNAVDVMTFPVHKKRNTKDVALIGVAHLAYYHGYDRVIRGMGEYYASNPKRDVLFHIVGPVDAGLGLEMLAEECGVAEKVIFHGFQSGKDLDLLFDYADIGVECLAMFRRDSEETAVSGSLKSREYLARGVPFIMSGKMDIPVKELEFIFELVESEECVNISKILEWYDNLKQTPENIRAYAIQNLSWTYQMEKVLKKLEE